MVGVDNIKEILEGRFKAYYHTINIVSKRDDSNSQKPMIDNNEEKIYNYDNGILKKISSGENRLCSVDGIDIKDNKLYFIEFKDGKIFGDKQKDERKIIRLKAIESLFEFIKLDKSRITLPDIFNYPKVFVLVYSIEAHIEIKDFEIERKKIMNVKIRDFHKQMEKYKDLGLYNEILIYEKEDFIKEYFEK